MDFLADALAKLTATPEQVESLVRGLSEEQLSRNPPSGMFSLRENVLHLRDVDVLGYLERVRLILDEDHPLFPNIDGAKLSKERAYNSQSIGPALEDLRAARATSVARLKGCVVPDLDRQAELEGVGTINLRRLLELWMEHDEGHIKDMAALRHALESGKEPLSVPKAPHQAA